MMISSTHKTLVLTTLLLSSLTVTVARPPISSAGSSMVWCYWALVSEDSCTWGSMLGPCGPVCLRGPGAVCGGAEDRYGVCGTGLTCSEDNRCEAPEPEIDLV